MRRVSEVGGHDPPRGYIFTKRNFHFCYGPFYYCLKHVCASKGVNFGKNCYV